jgi:protein kinase
MRRFEELEVLGNGAFGTVTKCRNKETGEIIAIKKMKQRYGSFEECLQLKEVKSLRKIKHTNVVKLLQVFRENEYLFLVFELLGKSLLKTANERGSYPEDEVRSIMWQVLTGLAYVHRQGFFHRDLKPDNLLWKEDVLKIADFGLAREIRSRPPYTEYCGTRWYRAPEIILRSEFYNSPVDIWAAGVTIGEMLVKYPFFDGDVLEDVILHMTDLVSSAAILEFAKQYGIEVGREFMGVMSLRAFPSWKTLFDGMRPEMRDEDACDLLQKLLVVNPPARMSAAEAMAHPFFAPLHRGKGL